MGIQPLLSDLILDTVQVQSYGLWSYCICAYISSVSLTGSTADMKMIFFQPAKEQTWYFKLLLPKECLRRLL